MPYLIFTANGEEFDRRELDKPTVLGRAPDCDVTIPDILLSRHHCRIEPTDNGRDWRIVDLHSKNGTHLRGRAIDAYVLRDADELRIGRTRLTFMAADYVPPASHVRRRGVIRPADPDEALAGTVTGMVLCEPSEVEKCESFPYPQPRPSDPKAYAHEDLYGMIEQIASSSWDSIMEQNSSPVRMQRVAPTPMASKSPRAGIRPKARVAFCLQAEHRETAATILARPPAAAIKSSRSRRPKPWMMVSGGVAAALMIAVCVAVMLPSRSRSTTPRALPREQDKPAVQITEPVTWDAVAVAA
jgi:hypothetical protein